MHREHNNRWQPNQSIAKILLQNLRLPPPSRKPTCSFPTRLQLPIATQRLPRSRRLPRKMERPRPVMPPPQVARSIQRLEKLTGIALAWVAWHTVPVGPSSERHSLALYSLKMSRRVSTAWRNSKTCRTALESTPNYMPMVRGDFLCL